MLLLQTKYKKEMSREEAVEASKHVDSEKMKQAREDLAARRAYFTKASDDGSNNDRDDGRETDRETAGT